jgi:hypothetical protein
MKVELRQTVRLLYLDRSPVYLCGSLSGQGETRLGHGNCAGHKNF